MQWLMDDLTDAKYTYLRFDFRALHKQLTLVELNELKKRKMKLLSVSGFIDLYLKKLMPLELGVYIGKNWNNDVPLEMKWKFIRILYNYANGDDLQKHNYKSANSIRAYIYYQYMIFIEQNYYLLKKKGMQSNNETNATTIKGDMLENDDIETKRNDIDVEQMNEGMFDDPYDLEAIIKYILIPKSTGYNGIFLKKWYDEHNKVTWGGAEKMSFNYQYSFLGQFIGIPSFNQSNDNAFFERFFEFIFTENGKKYWNKFVENKANISDENVLKFLRASTTDSSSVINTFSQYIDGEFIEKIRLRSVVNNAMELDKLDENLKQLKELYGISYVSNLKNEVLIEFDKFKNPKYFNLNELIQIFVNVKNTTDLTIKVFAINTKSYYRDKEQQIETDMNLDGLSGSYEWILTNKEIGIKNAYHKQQICIDFPKQLNGKRGVYFVDILSNGRHARSVIKIGDIRYVTRITEAGHLFQLLDENNKIIKNGSIFMSKHLYKTNKKGEIYIPFTTSPNTSQTIILQRNDDPKFNVLTHFDHKNESYSMQCGIYVDREQLLEKKRATIIVRVGLFLNNNRITNTLLENVKLSVKLKTGDGVDVDKTFGNFQLNDDKESVATFTVPNEPRSISIRLDAEIKNMSQNNKQSLSKTQKFKINSIDKSKNIGQMFLIPNNNNSYIIACNGKNGEGIANKDILLSLDSKYHKEKIAFSLTTDKYGRVYLPENINDNYIRLRASCSSSSMNVSGDWDFNYGINLCDTTNIINMTTNSSVSIPYVPKVKNDEIIFGLFDKYYIQSYNDNHLEYNAENGYITITNLPAGNFILKCLDLDYDINIYVTKYGQLIDNDRYSVNKNEIVELSPVKSLQISKIEQTVNEKKEDILSVKLDGINDRTRVHILATHMISRFSISKYLNCINPSSLSRKFITQCSNFYLRQRVIGEELRYILEREKANKYIGNSLIRPSFLIKPLEHKKTANKTQTAAKGGNIEKKILEKKSLIDSLQRKLMTDSALSLQSPNEDKYNIEFIGATTTLIINQKPNINTGILNINISEFNINQKFIRVIAFDEENCVIRGLTLHNKKSDMNISEYECPEYEYTDNRLNPGLNPKFQYVDQRNIILLNEKGNDYKLDDFKTSQIETYQSFSDIFNLIQTISGNHELKVKWSFLTQWNKLNEKEKLKQYDEFFCHELHLFLKNKDNEFFKKVCRPLISSKLNKDFMDYYLLNDKNELLKYCNLENLKSLNPLEQILLGKLFKNDKPELSDSLLSFFKSKQESLSINPQLFDKLFRTALATKAMDDMPTIQQNIETEMKLTLDENENENENENDEWSESDTESDYSDESDSCDSDSDDFASESSSDWCDDDDDDDDDDEDDEWLMFEAEEDDKPQILKSRNEKKKKKKRVSASTSYDCLSYKSYKNKNKNKMKFGGKKKERENMRQIQLFKQVDQTIEYQETYYYKILYEKSNKNVIPLNMFWCSYGIHMLNNDENICNKPFLSQYFLFATTSINEILCLLSVMDIEFNNKNSIPQFKYGENGINDQSVRLIAQIPTILFAKELKKQDNINVEEKKDIYNEESDTDIDEYDDKNKEKQSISIHVVYFDPDNRHDMDENGERIDKFANKYDMRCGKIYGCLSILTNVSSIRQSIEILCQIPTGSIPVNGGFRTKTNFITLNAYSVHKFEFYFYFPENGKFRQYPIVVTKKNKIIGTSKKSKNDKCKIKVKYEDKNKKLDIKSWKDVSINGTNDNILNYLKTHNLNQLDITWIYYKLKNDNLFYDSLIEILRKQSCYDSNIWAINLYWFQKLLKTAKQNEIFDETDDGQMDLNSRKEIQNRLIIIREYLCMNASFKSLISPYFKTDEFEYDDLYNNKYNYLEYIPLVNARAHLLGHKREILNDSFKTQYMKCLYRCSYRSTSVFDLKYDDILSLLYYLLLQDRIEEALDLYSIIKNNKQLSNNIENKVPICFDYFKVYMALFVDNDEEGIDNAIVIANNIKNKYENCELISSKKKLFEDITVLLNDLNEYKRDDVDVIYGIGDRDRNMNKLADKTPSLDFIINKTERKLIISSVNINEITVNFYTMNTEILFSNSPFFKNENNDNSKAAFAYVAPNISNDIEIKRDDANESNKTEYVIPNELKNLNLFIEIISSTLNVSKPFYDHKLNVLIKSQYGQLKVLVPLDENKNKLIPLQKAYVKVYSETINGKNEFYKDGYTDIRGKFDYVSISTDQLNKTTRFSIFVTAPGYGSIIKQAKPPKR